MYLAAYKAGVPLFSPEIVEKNSGSLFLVRGELKECFNAYMRTVGGANRLEDEVINHMSAYYHWRWGRTVRRRERDKAIQAQIAKGNTVMYAPLDRYMAVTDAEWESDVAEVAANKTGYFRSKTVPHEDVLFAAWKGTLRKSLSEPDREAFDRFFDSYVHDSVAGFKEQMSEAYLGIAERSRWGRNRQYFLGKRGSKFIYWRYEGASPASAPAKVAILRPGTDSGSPATTNVG